MKPVDRDDINLTKIGKTIWQNWIIVLSIVITFALLAKFIIYNTTPIYESTVTISIKKENSNSQILDELLSPRKKSEDITLTDRLELAKLTITSKKFISTIVDKIDKKNHIFTNKEIDNKEDIVLSNITVVSSNRVLLLTYRDTLPDRAQSIAQEIAESYISYNLNYRKREIENSLIFIKTQLSDIKKKLNKNSNKLRRYQQENSISTTKDATSSILNQINEKKEQYRKIYLQLSDIDSFIKNFKNEELIAIRLINNEIDISPIQSLLNKYKENNIKARELIYQKEDISNSTTSNINLNKFIDKKKEQERLLYKLEETLTDRHPDIISLNREITIITNEIYSYINTQLDILERDKSIIKSKIINNIEIIKKNLKNKENLLEKEIKEKHRLLSSIPSKKITKRELERDFNLNDKVYSYLLQKKIELEVTKASIIPKNKIVENATILENPVEPNIFNTYMILSIVGLLLAIGLVLIKDLSSKKVKEPEDIEALTTLPIYGFLPNIKNNNIFIEELRSIRTNLEFIYREKKSCVKILISSTIEQEGKTTLASELGKIITKAERKVLIIDLDLRKPRLHKVFNIDSNKKGISEYLSKDDRNIILSIDKNLDFIPAGEVLSNGSELLIGSKLDKLINSLEINYDYIIIDTAPISRVTDTSILFKYSDIFLFVVRAKVSERSYITRFQKIVEEREIKSVAIIINDIVINKNNIYTKLGYD